jgi:Flp pilus assembly protein protease CpaA
VLNNYMEYLIYDIKVFVLIFALCVSAYQDVKQRRVSNWVTITPLIFLIMLNLINSGIKGFGYSLLGAVLAIIAGVILQILHSAGGGDIKLLAVIGSFSGPVFLFEFIRYFVLACGFVSVIYLVSSNKLRYVLYSITSKLTAPDKIEFNLVATVSMPMAVPIMLSGVAALCF